MNKIHCLFGDWKKNIFQLHKFIFCILIILAFAAISKSYANNSGVQNDTQSQIASVHKKGEQIIFDLPVNKDIDISPDYSHPSFSLKFSPSLSALNIPDTEEIDLIKDINVGRSSPDAEISSLDILLNKEVQFLLSRTQPENLQLKFVPALNPEKSREQKEKTTKETTRKHNKIKDIRFTQDEEGTLLIKLLTQEKTPYKPQPEQKKNKLKLFLSDIKIPSHLTKIYDLQKFKAPVKTATLLETSKGGELELTFSKRSPVSVSSKQNKLLVSVQSLKKESKSEQERQQNTEKKTESKLAQGKKLFYPEMDDKYSGKKISIDLQDADIEHVLRLIAQVAGYNLILGDNVSGEISLKLENIPWDQALDLVLIQKDLGMVKKGNILRVVTLRQLREEQKRIEQTQKAAQKRAPLHTEYIQINYTNAETLQSNIKKFLSDRGKVSVDQRTNQLIVSDTRENINKIREVVQELDRPERQVLIEARLVYATDQFQRGLGIQWGGGYEYKSTYKGEDYNQGVYGASNADNPISVSSSPENSGFAVNLPNQGSTTLGIGAYISKLTGSNLFTLDARLEIGESKDQVKTISSPRVVTLNNQQAKMIQGTKLATQGESESGGTTTEYTEAALELSVTPQITPNNKLILDLDISDDSPVAGGGGDIETRETSTKVIVNNKETIVLGGVREVTQNRQKSKVPWMAEIPLLGWLFKSDFKSKDKRELLIFIRPKILSVS